MRLFNFFNEQTESSFWWASTRNKRLRPFRVLTFYYQSYIHCFDHSSIACIIGVKAIPFSVNEYSIRTGVSG